MVMPRNGIIKKMRRSVFVLPLLAAFVWAAPPASKKPKLVLAIVVDQFRYDYLTRFRQEYKGGFDRMLTRGAVFTNAHYQHFPTVTAVGHSTFLSGATPALSGIVGNEWYDRETGAKVTSVSDPETKVLGGSGEVGSSPRRLLVSTIGDEIRMADGESRAVGVSLKDRAAILPSGHMARGAYWFDGKTGNFVSSNFYFTELPAWVKDFDSGRPADKFANTEWMGHKFGPSGKKFYESLPASPWGNELIESFAERAVQAERLGQRESVDLLTVSFSSNDYIGHELGPDSPEVHDISVRTDRLLEKFFAFLDKQVGMSNILVVMTADHGVAPLPEVSAERKMPGGRMFRDTGDAVQAALSKRYGFAPWIADSAEHSIYLNWSLIESKKLDLQEVTRVAADAVMRIPHVFRVYTREQLMRGAIQMDTIGARVENGFFERRSPDISVMLDPYWMYSAHGTTHGTAFDYDTHVPVIFMGPGIRAGKFYQSIVVNDVAPTLAAILGIETPSGSVGRVLSEIFSTD